MLCLGRKPGESVQLFLGGVFIGRVIVSELQPNKVRIAFDVVDELRVLRTEIVDSIVDSSVEATADAERIVRRICQAATVPVLSSQAASGSAEQLQDSPGRVVFSVPAEF